MTSRFAVAGATVAALVATVAAVVDTPRAGVAARGPERPAAPSGVVDALDRLPLTFEANAGQVDPEVAYLARTGRGGTTFLTSSGAVFAGPEAAFRLRLDGAEPAPTIVPGDRQPGIVNYLKNDDPTEWQTGVPTYGSVRYGGVYPGIDLLWHGSRGGLEYDFIVQPSADPSSVAFVLEGSERLRLEPGGDLVATTGGAELRQRKPELYQDIDGRRVPVEGSFTLGAGSRVGFSVGPYDRSKPLVIDPLVYSSFIGGTAVDDVKGLAVDGSGNLYVTGNTSSSNFPTTAGVLQPGLNNVNDAYVAKINPTATAIVWATHLGASTGGTSAAGIGVDGSGNAIVAGSTMATNFPVSAGAFQANSGGGEDGFVAKLNSTGSALLYSSYLGGGGGDAIGDMAIDPSGNAYVAGRTTSITGFPVTAGAVQTTASGPAEAFAAKLTTTGAGTNYATYLGGSGDDDGRGIAVDGSGNAYVTGATTSTNFPTTAGSFQPARPAAFLTAFLVKLNSGGTARTYSTYFGATSSAVQESGEAVAVDSAGNAYVAGAANSDGLPTTVGAFQATKPNGPGASMPFVAKFNAAGSGLTYSTWLGGFAGSDQAWTIRVDGSGRAFVSLSLNSASFPMVNAVQANKVGGFYDAGLAVLNASGSGLVFSTYFGGGASDTGLAVAIDGSGNAYLGGASLSTNLTTTPGVFLPTHTVGGTENYDGFIAKMSIAGPNLRHPPADFDGDFDTDISVYRPSVGGWFILNQATIFFGTSTDLPVPADYNGDGSADIAVFRPSAGAWFIQGQPTVFSGTTGDLPVPADYNGDGTADVAVFRPSVGAWFIGSNPPVFFGANGDIPVPADYNGDGSDDIAVFRPSVGAWFIQGQPTVFSGANGDYPVPLDYFGSAAADIATFRPSVGGWYFNGQPTVFEGAPGDIPVPGNYVGDSKAEIAVFRPSVGGWYISGQSPVFFGSSGDHPLPLPIATAVAHG